jgi:MATE family multidrug resistance protein
MSGVANGSVRELLPIALPILLSQAIDVAMNFCDRVFLGQIGKEELAATLSGGILTYMTGLLVMGVLAQINPLVAQNIGAGRKQDSVGVVHQGFIFAIIVAPLVYCLGYFLAPKLFEFFNHNETLVKNEVLYFRILSLTIFTTAMRQVLANFFIGIGRTKVVTLASLTGVLVNLPLAYALIFGVWGFPRLDIAGAAWATVIASLVPVVILSTKFFSQHIAEEYGTRRRLAFVAGPFRIFLRYGLPAGVERFMNVAGFMFFTMVMYSFSPDVAAATTIALNWDMVSFLPLVGLSDAASSLVGKYLGMRYSALALRSAWSGLRMGWLYSGIITIVYFTLTRMLVHIFSPQQVHDFAAVEAIAMTFLKISCLYFFCDGTYSVLGGILKGAGDTRWTMLTSNILMWSTAITVYLTKEKMGLTPVGGWWALTGMVFALGILYFWRFSQKRWLHRLMIADKI